MTFFDVTRLRDFQERSANLEWLRKLNDDDDDADDRQEGSSSSADFESSTPSLTACSSCSLSTTAAESSSSELSFHVDDSSLSSSLKNNIHQIGLDIDAEEEINNAEDNPHRRKHNSSSFPYSKANAMALQKQYQSSTATTTKELTVGECSISFLSDVTLYDVAVLVTVFLVLLAAHSLQLLSS